ncbi:MAG: hypothetical protein EXX96DRAFT_253245 [Benjaminiella poitrasii]|nr:MAG: hypothetical protein EXX96DRAFT_253245 [Benjaminiella poitrasii]
MFSSWFKSDTNNELISTKKDIVGTINKKNSTTTTFKVAPTVKATSVNVIKEDAVNNNDTLSSSGPVSIPNTNSNNLTINEPFTFRSSASISLSIELAKNTSMSSINQKPWMQKPDTPPLQKSSSLPKHSNNNRLKQESQIQRSGSIGSHYSSHSLLHRMAHSPKKASAATSPTSVSTNGNVVYDPSLQKEEQNNNSSSNKIEIEQSPAIKSLTKRIQFYNSASADTMDELTEADVMNHNHSSIKTNSTSSTVSMNSVEDETDNQQQSATVQSNMDSNLQVNSRKTTTTFIDADQGTVITQENTASSSAMNNPVPLDIQSNTEKEAGSGFWSWLGFTNSQKESVTHATITKINNDSAIIREETVKATSTTMTNDRTTPKASSWLLPFLFSSASNNSPIESAPSLVTNTSNRKDEHSNDNQDIQPEQLIDNSIKSLPEQDTIEQNIRKVKSTSSLPITSPTVLNSASPSLILRHPASIAAFHESTQTVRRKKNIVLPLFETLFETQTEKSSIHSPPSSPAHSASSNFLTKAMDAINSILIPSPPKMSHDKEDDSTTNSNWIASRMKAKFATFIEDIKSLSSLSNQDPVKKAMINKRIVVVGVHGWFPMKVKKK